MFAGQTVVAQPVHVQQLLKLKQQAVQQQKAIQPQAAPGPATVQQKVLGSLVIPSSFELGPAAKRWVHRGGEGPERAPPSCLASSQRRPYGGGLGQHRGWSWGSS